MSYRNVTRNLWETYGLIEQKKGKGLGKVRRYIASLFVTRCFHRYLSDDGILGFLISFNVLKTQGAEGFRKYLTYRCKVMKVQELSELYPFEGATNRTGILVIKKGKSQFPIDCKMWHYQKTSGIPQDIEIEEVSGITSQHNMKLFPIEKNHPDSPWMICTDKSYDGIKKVIKRSEYQGHEGVITAMNGVYWLRIESSQPNGLLVENLAVGKKEVKKKMDAIEKDLVFPLLRGKDVKRWKASSSVYIFVPHDPNTGKPIDEKTMRSDFPKSYNFISNFRKALEKRSLHKLWGRKNPFYSLYDIGAYSFSPYKVIWKDVAGKISAKGEFGGATVAQMKDDEYVEKKTFIPDSTLMSISCKSLDEAHYISAMMNSIFTRFIATAYAILHVRAHILKYIGIGRYNPKDKRHIKLVSLSKKTHELIKKGGKIESARKEIDKVCAKIHNVSDSELKEIEKTLRILRGS